MKKITSLILLFCFLLNSGAGFAQRLRDGQSVIIRLSNRPISSEANELSAVVAVDVIDPQTNNVLIEKGTPVEMNSIIKEPKGVGKPAELTLEFMLTKAVDGKDIYLDGSFSETGEDRAGLALGLGIGLGIFIWPAFFCLCIKGGDVELPVTDMLIDDVFVKGNYTISEK